MPQTNPLQQSFEKINDITGGVSQQVVDTVKDATKESIGDIKQAPLDILNDLIGASAQESGGGAGSGDGNQQTQTIAGMQVNPGDITPEFQQKLEEEQKQKAEKMAQHRKILQEFEEHHKRKKAEEEQQEQVEEQQEEMAKQQEVEEEKKKKEPHWRKIIKGQLTGSREGAKKKF